MLKINEDRIVMISVQGKVAAPPNRGGHAVDRDGKPFLLPSIGGIVYNALLLLGISYMTELGVGLLEIVLVALVLSRRRGTPRGAGGAMNGTGRDEKAHNATMEFQLVRRGRLRAAMNCDGWRWAAG